MEDRSNEVLAVAGLFLVLAWVTTSLRVYVRGFLLSNTWGKDDWFMVATTLIFTVYLACQVVAAVHGTGRHRWGLNDKDARIALFFWYLCELLYILANCTLKFSLLFFYLRVAIQRWHIWTIRVMMMGAVLFGVVYFFLVALQCSPVDEFWNNHPASNKCFPESVTIGITYTMSAINAVADWTIGILPFFIVWGLTMKRKTKLLVAAILAFAAIGSTATVIRMGYVHHLMNGTDFLYATTDVAIWSTVEPGIGITAGNIATLRPLIRSFLGRKESSNASEPEYHQRFGRAHNRKDRRGYRRSLSPSDLIPTEYSGTTSTKIFAEQMELDSIPEGTTSEDVPAGPRNPVMRNSEEGSRFQRHIKQTVTVEHAYEGAPHLHLRDSFRNSFGRETMFSLGELSTPPK